MGAKTGRIVCAWLRKSVAKVPGQNFDHRWLFRKINQHPRSEKGNVSGSFVDSGALEVKRERIGFSTRGWSRRRISRSPLGDSHINTSAMFNRGVHIGDWKTSTLSRPDYFYLLGTFMV